MDDYDNDYQEDDMQPIEVKRVPESQITDLTEEQLNETFTRVVTAADPNAAQGLSSFSHTEAEYQMQAHVEHLAVHFSMDGMLVHVDSEDAAKQKDYLAKKEELESKAAEQGTGTSSDGEMPDELGNAVLGASGVMMLKNQFNFSGRATQTFNNPLRHKEVYTEPPPTEEFSFQVTQWEIFDAYVQDYERKREAAKMEEQKKPILKLSKNGEEENDATLTFKPKEENKEEDIFAGPRMARAVKTLERMVHMNSEAECFQDYKYYEDKSEHKREDGRGSFLPLWRFSYEKVSKKTSTGICWNKEFTDLFAVSYGSYDFTKQGAGRVCCYSLKNTSFPEYQFETEHGAMCIDFHPVHSSLLCVGLYDGSVSVYDIRSKTGKPIFTSDDPKKKHTDPVWQVRWDQLDLESSDKNIAFFSISSDGRVTKWVLSKNELINEELIKLKLQPSEIEDEPLAASAVEMVGHSGGSCFDFNNLKKHLFVVGTEEGALHLYSKQYGSKLLRTFLGHHMAVYSVCWNTYHPKVFLTCSADWTVKLWEANERRPIMTFDLNTSVGDVAWAPFSSTVFACITRDGKVRVYDLSVNKHEPIGETRVRGRSKLTHVSFNPTEPILCVGDDRGVTTIFKLSSNLRRMSAPKLEDVEVEEEIAKLNRVMIMPDPEGDEDINEILEQTKRVD